MAPLQVWILKGKSDDMYRSMWEKAMDEMIDKHVFTLELESLQLKYLADFDRWAVPTQPCHWPRDQSML